MSCQSSKIPDLNWKFDENIDQVEATKTMEAVETAEIVKPTETVEIEESTPETICTTEIPQEAEEQQGKHSACRPTSPESTTNSCPTTTEIQTTPTKGKAQTPSTAEQATQITPTTEQAIQSTTQTPEVNNSLVTNLFSAFRPAVTQPASNYGLQF